MDIFVRHVPPHATKKQLERFFDVPLQECGIKVFHAEKIRGKPLAVLTILDSICGQEFLNRYGVPQGSPGHVRAKRPLQWDGRFVQCTRSRNDPSDFSVRSLAMEASQRAASAVPPAALHGNVQNVKITRFDITALQCGLWDYKDTQLAFMTHYRQQVSGNVTFGEREAIILLGDSGSDQIRIDINYRDCDNIILGSTYQDPSISFALRIAPKFYRICGLDVLSARLTAMALGPFAAKEKVVKKTRLTSIDNMHGKIAGMCFVYRITLSNSAMLGRVRALLAGNAKMPATLSLYTSILLPAESVKRSKERLDLELTDTARFGAKPFSLRYQLDRLARNGVLHPLKVLELLPTVQQMHQKYGLDATLAALRRFYRQVPPAGPDIDATELAKPASEQRLEEYAENYDRYAPENPYELAKRHVHINLIHKVVITPTGIQLGGPEPEPTNRVLRKYSSQADNFIRVIFQDEDGGSVRYDPRSSQDLIYHQRFKQVLDGTILIAGLGYSFLGFSHSSLRSQSCWFMAPLVQQGSLVYAPQVLKELGDFSHIRTPAKCAARIGQCFTDTATSVKVVDQNVKSLPVVERNGRDFGDGVGTISRVLLEEVWRVYGTRRLLKPTILQIRFQGAKGVVSLDSRLQGRQLLLRSNMKKFESPNSWDLEICGAAFRPLPMILNRQLIKILEDLGVRSNVFLDLQTYAVNKLRCMTTSAMNTATLLESIEMAKATRVPSLIKMLDEIGLDYHGDHFLYSIVEMAVVHHLRDIKYRGRIPVEQGVTLYGIMDETGELQEGEVYVATEAGPEGGRDDIPRDNIIVTRSPAMHPGDVQIVNAVAVSDCSPLKKLSNVVVFSQHGARDLPSQLSGGDLDGDIYNVIWDKRLKSINAAVPADYPRVAPVELDRAVTAKDMSDFFVTFMETDQLGMICNIHLQLADQKPNGTFNPDCLKLAGMASTAVDYSKTGIPVDMKQCPKYDRCRPDFMAPSPRVIVSQQGYLDLEDDNIPDDDAFDGLDAERRPYRYYESQKALGQLYRAIDEAQFLQAMQRQHHLAYTRAQTHSSSLLQTLLAYMQKQAANYGIMYTHHEAFAREIRASYEDSLVDIMYYYEPTVHSPLSEHEVFAGNILGRQGGAQGKPLRELSKTMRERFDAVVEYAVVRITKGDRAVREAVDLDDLAGYNEREFEALPRAIACLGVAVGEVGWVDRRVGEVKGFGYVAAGACLRELQRYRITTFGSYTLPRVARGSE